MDTPKGQVQFAHDQHGVKAAREKAKELGVVNKVERWLNDWEGKAPKKTASPKGGVERTGKRRVRELGHPTTRKGTVIAEGPQVSQVQWDDGSKRFVANEWLVTQVKKGARDG